MAVAFAKEGADVATIVEQPADTLGGLDILVTERRIRVNCVAQLAQCTDETAGAARSGALALDLWIERRSTDQLTSVQLSDP